MPQDEVEQLAAAPELLSAFDTTLVMSHLACADHPDDPMNERQRAPLEPRARVQRREHGHECRRNPHHAR